MSNRRVRPHSVALTKENEDLKMASLHRRRSPRNSITDKNIDIVTPLPAVKRSITVRKIVPRKTQVTEIPTPALSRSPQVTDIPIPAVRRSPRALSEGNKENLNSLSERKAEKRKISARALAPAPSLEPTVISPILAPAPAPGSPDWPQKVRRSYSRLSFGDRSFESPPGSPPPHRRGTLFGFEELQTPPVAAARAAEKSRLRAETSGPMSGVSLLRLEDNSMANSPEQDINIPGVAVVKEKRKRRKRVPEMKVSELDLLAAKMNAEFQEAESFDLVVE